MTNLLHADQGAALVVAHGSEHRLQIETVQLHRPKHAVAGVLQLQRAVGAILLPDQLVDRRESLGTEVDVVAGTVSADYAAELTGRGIDEA